MFARVNIALLALLLALVAVTTATPLTTRNDPPTQCNTGEAHCCNSMQSASRDSPSALVKSLIVLNFQSSDPVTGLLMGLLGIVGNLGSIVGLQCSPITGIGAGGTSCSVQTVCCTGDSFGNGLIVLGCTPITLVL